MAFKVNVLFTGIVGFVGSQEDGYRVLVPNTLQGKWDGGVYVPDGPPPRYYKHSTTYPCVTHYPVLDGGSFKWALDGHAVHFSPEFAGDPPALAGSLDDLLSMSEIWGRQNPPDFDGSPLDPDVRDHPESHPDRCAVYCDIGVGQVQTRFPAAWSVKGRVTNGKNGPDPYVNACLAWAVQWTLPNLRSLAVSAIPYQNGGKHEALLAARAGEEVNLLFGNLCDEPWMSPKPLKHRSPDPDFVWHYELFRPDFQVELASRAQGQILPHPEVGEVLCSHASNEPKREDFPHLKHMGPATGLLPSPSGQNCMPARWW